MGRTISLGPTLASRTEQVQALLVWGTSPSDRAEVGSIEELDSVIDQLERRAKRPLIVDVIVAESGSVSLGLGRERTVVSFVPESQDPPYFHSIGTTEDGDDLIFFYYDEWTEFPRRQAIPISLGREVLRRYVRERALPDIIEWEES